MKKKLTSILAILLVLAFAFSFNSCSKDEREKKYLRLGVSEDAAGINLLVIGKLAGTQKLSTYVYFDSHAEEGYADRIIEYMNDAHGLDVAYFEESDVDAILAHNAGSEDPLKVIFIDSFNEDGSIHGFYAAKESWISVRTKDYQKFVNGLLQSAKYRYENSSAPAFTGTYAMKRFDRERYLEVYEANTALKLAGDILFQESKYSVENNITIQTSAEQFISLYEIDNFTYDALTKKFKTDADTLALRDRFEDVSFNFISIESYLALFEGTPINTEENLAKAKEDRSYTYNPDCDANEKLAALLGEENLKEILSLDKMVTEMVKVNKETVAAKKDYTKAIVIVTGAAVLIIAAVLFFIIKKSKSKKKISLKKIMLGEE